MQIRLNIPDKEYAYIRTQAEKNYRTIQEEINYRLHRIHEQEHTPAPLPDYTIPTIITPEPFTTPAKPNPYEVTFSSATGTIPTKNKK